MAKVIAVGQTTGSWGAEFSHREKQMQAHMGEVLEVGKNDRGELIARIGFPRINTENDIPSLLTMIFGKFSLAGPARIVDIKLPCDYGIKPKFGMQGIRELCGVHDRPFIMGIFKPALGLSPQDHADLLSKVAGAGLDIIKDDEINFNLASCPTLKRVEVCRKVIDENKQRNGKEILYAVNISGRADQMVENAKSLINAGANALLLNVLCYGFSCLEALASHPDVNVPIFTHPALSGVMGGATDGTSEYGIDYGVLLGTLNQYAGADAVLYPAHYGSLPFAASTEFQLRDMFQSPVDDRPSVLPVPSAGIHPGIVGRALRDYGNDVALNAGSAIFDHPSGPEAGTQAFFDALEVVRRGEKLVADEVQQDALKIALKKWGGE